MPDYDTENFDPPAPVAYVTLSHPATGVSLSDVPMLMDTGADVSLVPLGFIEQLGVEPDKDKLYEIQGFVGETKLAQVAQLELIFVKKKFLGQFLLIDQPIGILGRNILNMVAILFDGPKTSWFEAKR
jgi:hypothetical protein